MFDIDELRDAHAIVLEALRPTPTLSWPLLARRLGAEVAVKHENHQPTGAFKVRGGLVFADRLRRRLPDPPGLISATRGNHGQSLAFAGRRFRLPVTIVAPRGNSVEKNAAMRAQGAELIEHGEDFQAAREEAQRLSTTRGLLMVPSFHRDLVLGVATYALEMFTERPDLDVLYTPIGLGSGICGCIAVRDLLGLKTEIVGVQASAADGMATRVPDEEALAIIRRGVSRIVLVSDAEIAAAVRAYWTDTHNLAEGAGAAPLAAALQERASLAGRRVGLVLSGGNIDFDLFQNWIAAPPDAPAA
jgi:threonine dehydratase